MAVKNGWTSLAPRRTEQSHTPRGSQLRWCHLGSLETGPPGPSLPGEVQPHDTHASDAAGSEVPGVCNGAYNSVRF